jgi:hypothetical protein
VVAHTHNGERIAALVSDELPEIRTVRGNITLRLVTDRWPAAGIKQFPTSRPAPVVGRSYLRAECGFRLADDEIKREAGLPVESVYVECQIILIGFWSMADAWLHRGEQCCATDKESVDTEALASLMIG